MRPRERDRLRGDVLIARESSMIFRRRDDRHPHRASFAAGSNPNDFHSVGFLVELLPVFRQLAVVSEEIIVAYVVTELFLWSCDVLLRAQGEREGQDKDRAETHLTRWVVKVNESYRSLGLIALKVQFARQEFSVFAFAVVQ